MRDNDITVLGEINFTNMCEKRCCNKKGGDLHKLTLMQIMIKSLLL
jgi:hypothetical protein